MAVADQRENDPTGRLLSLQNDVTAVVVSKQDGVVAGVEETIGLLEREKIVSAQSHIKDGNRMFAKDPILTLHGPAAAILSTERLILSVLGRMSGIATLTHHYCSLFSDTADHQAIAATRKTPWMLLDKKAVAVGGGLTHRLSLATPMIKDNHLTAVSQLKEFTAHKESISYAVQRAISSGQPFFEIEVTSADLAQAALETFTQEKKNHTGEVIMAIMLDNVSSAGVEPFMKMLRKHSLYGQVLVEVSGEITKENLRDWATSDVDIVSVGALTHSAPVANLSLTIV